MWSDKEAGLFLNKQHCKANKMQENAKWRLSSSVVGEQDIYPDKCKKSCQKDSNWHYFGSVWHLSTVA